METIYDFVVNNRKGEAVALSEYAGQVLLIVNTATECGFTPQYEDCTYKGLLGVSGQFGHVLNKFDYFLHLCEIRQY